MAEMRQGALDANWGQRKWDLLEAYLADFSVLNSDNLLCSTWAQVRNESARKGRQMSAADARIAASALVLSAPLVTNNPKRLPPFGQPPTRFRGRLNRRHSEADRGRPGDRSSVVAQRLAIAGENSPIPRAIQHRFSSASTPTSSSTRRRASIACSTTAGTRPPPTAACGSSATA